MKQILVLLAFSIASCAFLNAQTDSNTIRKIISQLDNFTKLNQEKVYLSFDKPYYTAGETMWFKAFLADAMSHATDSISAVLYVDMTEEATGRLVAQRKIKIEGSTSYGSIELPSEQGKNALRGLYNIHAYTQWMGNLPTDFHFNKSIYIFSLNEKSVAPVDKNMVASVQFFPEGGDLIEDLPCNMAFKAVNEQGKGVKVKAIIRDEKGDSVTTFQDDFKGMGRCSFKPSKGGKYTAYIEGITKTFPLPTIKPNGMSLFIDNLKPDMPVRLFAYLNMAEGSLPGAFYVVAHQRGKIAFASQIPVTDKNFKTFRLNIPRDKFTGEGIAALTVFDDKGKPLCERLIFVENKQKRLQISVKTNKTNYSKREKVTVDIETKNFEGKPVAVNLSFVVTNNSKITTPQYAEDLRAYMLLRSDLQGNIESPAYYFEDTTAAARRALDNLMMTQGWRRFTWEQVLKDKFDDIKYLPEFGITLRGIASVKNKPLADTTFLVTLMNPTIGSRFLSFKTNKNGEFLINNLDFTDSSRLIFKLMASAKSFDLNIMRSITPSIASSLAMTIKQMNLIADYPMQNISTYLESSKEAFLNEQLRTEKQIVLQEVEIKAKKRKETDPRVNYFPDKSYEVSELDIKTHQTLVDYLRSQFIEIEYDNYEGSLKIRPFRGSLYSGSPLLVIDNMAESDANMLNTIPMEDVERVNIIRTGTGSFSGIAGNGTNDGLIHILTKWNNPNYRSRLNFEDRVDNPATIVVGYNVMKQFYVPDYSEKKPEYDLPDHRTTIYWSPFIKTDLTGKTTVSFYNTDDDQNAQISVEGLDSKGKLGVVKKIYRIEN